MRKLALVDHGDAHAVKIHQLMHFPGKFVKHFFHFNG